VFKKPYQRGRPVRCGYSGGLVFEQRHATERVTLRVSQTYERKNQNMRDTSFPNVERGGEVGTAWRSC